MALGLQDLPEAKKYSFPACSDLRKAEWVPPFPVSRSWLEQSGLTLSKMSEVDRECLVPLALPWA